MAATLRARSVPAPPENPVHGFPNEALESRVFSIGEMWDDESLRDVSRNDPGLDRYVRLPLETRSEDIFLYNNTIGSYWRSEYTVRGEPIPFQCNFILHLTQQDSERTRIEVLEVEPRVQLGRELVMGHTGPAFVEKVVPVPPTTSDRLEMLERIQMFGR